MSDSKKMKAIPWLLIILPAWLLVSGGLALVKYFKDEKSAKAEIETRFAKSVSSDSIKDDLRKIIQLIGERNTTRPDQLRATASMIQGTLGPTNTGYNVSVLEGPANFPLIEVSIPVKDDSASPIWLVTSYDSPAGSSGAEKNATGIAATVAAAQALANSSPDRPIHFLFLPHANEADSPVLETAIAASKRIKSLPVPKALLCIEAMGDSETLILSSRDSEALPSTEINGLGEILGAEIVCLTDDFDLASTLFEIGLPAIRVATRVTLLPDESDEKLPFAPTLASSSGRLVELVKRLSKSSS